mmetsp:Transcript_62351/g.103704  ORF Transcript_62351/g.103704 Transcript_62351/m.103704 type:complete len:177 (+) Transcript_62351:52-582(+)|eukprot:CAMPEP_0119314240 /NCGR_PEP_ID=MMETSP1333-20130426/32168_1 /TAXON_ID=418940 /ORGANISM="Scyphosphaera apsteinii, Strain RCC1455" /LENGTH=176 /DNA_ID=CAMNT_0007319313 /DNA_START=51 /DNA_END=581 /DNA_ORIENTATION=+
MPSRASNPERGSGDMYLHVRAANRFAELQRDVNVAALKTFSTPPANKPKRSRTESSQSRDAGHPAKQRSPDARNALKHDDTHAASPGKAGRCPSRRAMPPPPAPSGAPASSAPAASNKLEPAQQPANSFPGSECWMPHTPPLQPVPESEDMSRWSPVSPLWHAENPPDLLDDFFRL